MIGESQAEGGDGPFLCHTSGTDPAFAGVNLEVCRPQYVRIYTPFGTHWFPYYYRRLRERKENIFFIFRHLFD